MAYNTQYLAEFNNDLENVVKIILAQKDGAVITPAAFTISECEFNDSSDENTILARELTFTIFADDATAITWETFLAGSYDEWKVTVTIDDQPYFVGFLTPEEGNAAFLPKPYDIKLRATNGIKLLNEVDLTDLNGANFHGKFTGIEYIAACLQKTLLELPFRAYGSIYNEDMDNRGDDPTAHYLDQIKFDHRSFMKDATTFMNCYDVLIAILGRHSRLFYWNGIWVIFFIPEYQYKPNGLWYTNYLADGTISDGGEETEGVATVGTTELIYPEQEDQIISSSFPIKFAKTIYNYKQYPEFPLNNKFQRGTQIGSGVDADGNSYKDYTIDDWVSATYAGNPTEYANLPGQTVANPDPWYRRSTFNAFGIEIKREVIIERETAAGGRYIQSSGEPVNAGDKIRISFDWKTDTGLGAGDPVPVQITPYVVEDGTGDKYVLRSKDGQVSEAKWELSGSQMIGIYTTPNGELTDYQSISVESPSFPINGTLYFMLWSSAQLGNNTKTFYKGFSVEYISFIAGGYLPISGDYWKHTQAANQIDKDEDEIKVSDSVTRVLQGCMLNADGVTATTPTWYREGVPESRHFKELVNIGRYNLGYRRFWRIEGSFTGLSYSTIDNPLIQLPLSYHKTYRFTDLTEPRDFILVAPLRMDLCTGAIKAVFEEVYKPGLTHNIGASLDTVIYGLIQMVLADFGLILTRYPPDRTMLKLISAAGDTVSAAAIDNGVGNSPSFLVNTQHDEGGIHIAIMTLDDNIEIGNQFSITVNGITHSYDVVDMIVQADGTQLGDSQEFNYIFSN